MNKRIPDRNDRPFLCFILILGSLQSCMFYYKVQKKDVITFQELIQFDSLKKYLILHYADTAWHLSINNLNDTALTGTVSVLPPNHMKYKNTNSDKANRYIHGDKNIKSRKPSEIDVLDEVHFYINDTLKDFLFNKDSVRIFLSTISKVEIYQKAKGHTTFSWVIPITSGIIITGGMIAIIWILASSSMFNGISF